MNARIETIKARNARQLFSMGLSQEEVSRREYLALMQETMIISEALDRILLDMPVYTFASFTLYGQEVKIVRYSGTEHEVYVNAVQWTGIAELACSAAEFALERGYLYANYLQ